MDRKAQGVKSVGIIMSRLIGMGKTVLLPIGDCERYDLVVDEGTKFVRIQCKTGRLVKGTLRFKAASTNLEHGKWTQKDYRGQADVFGVYCRELDKVYLVPVSEVGRREGSLRIEPTRTTNNVRWAKDFEMRA
jgi:hypothetical protein